MNKIQNCRFHPYYHRRNDLFIYIMIVIISMIIIVSAEPQEKKGLFSQMNNWFAKLRGNKDQNNQQNQDDQKKDDKKEEPTTMRPQIPMGPAAIYPPMFGMAAGPGFGPPIGGPGSPFAGMVAGAPPPMFHGPMTAMSTHQFAAHHHPPPPPRHLMHVGLSHGFGPFIGHHGTGGPIYSPYSQPSHLMPIHNDFADTYGSFGSPYSNEPNDPTETFAGPPGAGPMLGGGGGGGGPLGPHHHHHHHHHHPGSNADSMSDSAPGSSNYDDQYNK
ncbi:uncharacterized protein LOC113792552 [Dermatophagoides pteronyssinus]|uniref:uncharacterized protein LOC113792552 n=1 Tax=Dermatophagoides pteronyssinus TaxID=6956 RepID=UPI003F6796D9